MEPYQLLEEKWAEFNSLDPAGMVAVSSGTAALHLALEVRQRIHLPVITSTFNMVAAPRAVVLAGLTPVFVDCDDRLLMDKKHFAQAASRLRTFGVIVTHIYGRACDVQFVHECSGPGCFVIEDLAEAHGLRPHPLSSAACWSFYKNKTIHGEEGGAVWFWDEKDAKLARSLRSLGFTDAHDMTHIPRGHNYRMSNAHASLILENMLPSAYGDREKQVAMLDTACPLDWRMPARQAPWVYDFGIPELTPDAQNEVIRTLKEEGVQARHAFKPMHTQAEFESSLHFGGMRAERASREVVYVPLRDMTAPLAERIFKAAKHAC